MSRKPSVNPKINKKAFKNAQGCCRLCGETNQAILDVHRILPGAEGGKYTKLNSVTLCSNCHRKVHDNQLEIVRYFLSTNGNYLLLIKENGSERFI